MSSKFIIVITVVNVAVATALGFLIRMYNGDTHNKFEEAVAPFVKYYVTHNTRPINAV